MGKGSLLDGIGDHGPAADREHLLGQPLGQMLHPGPHACSRDNGLFEVLFCFQGGNVLMALPKAFGFREDLANLFATNKGGGFALRQRRRGEITPKFALQILAEREGFEPSIPVSRDTRLAGERLRPGSAISPQVVL